MYAQQVNKVPTRNPLLKLKMACKANVYALCVVARFSAAIVGGYIFTAVFTSLLSLILPLKKSDAVLLSISLTILVYSCVFIWAFAVKSLKTVWITILLTSSACGLSIALLKGWL